MGLSVHFLRLRSHSPNTQKNGTVPSFCARYGGLKLNLYSKRLWGSFSDSAFSHPSPATAIADRQAVAISNAAVVAEHVSENNGAGEVIAGQIRSPYSENRTFIRRADQKFSIRSPTQLHLMYMYRSTNIDMSYYSRV